MGLSIPLSCVRLLVPPLRLISAFIWRAVQQHNLQHYDKVEENILLITKMIPEILSERQRTALIMGLRAKMILEMFKEELPTDVNTVKARLKTIESSSMFKSTGSEVEILQGRLLKLVVSLLEDPAKKENFFKEIFPIEYGPEFDKALQVLVGHFLSRLEQLLPVPNFKQAAMWLDSESLYWEEVVQVHWDPNHLLPFLQSDYHGMLEKNELPSLVEDRIISSLSLSASLDEGSPTECKILKTMNTFPQRNQEVVQEMETDVSDLNFINKNQDVVQEIEIDIPELVVPSSVQDVVQEIETDIPDLSVPSNIQDVIKEIKTDVPDLSVLSETQDVVQEIETDIPDLSVPSSIQDVVVEINTDLNVLSSIHDVVQEIETDIPDLSSNQDVIQKSEADLIPLQNFNLKLNHEVKGNGPDQNTHVVDTLNQEDSSEAEHVALSLTSKIQKQEQGFREENINESHFYEAEVQMVNEFKGETSTEIKRSESSSELTDTQQTNGGEEGHNTSASESNSGQRLKVVVPKHLVPVVKQISLPSVLLSRCNRSHSVQNKQALNPSTKSSFSENTRSRRRRSARSYKPGHTGSGSYKCVHCNLSFKTHFQASVHRRKKHELIYSCPKCEKSFKSLKAWTKHRTEHKEEKPQQCTDCGEQCPNLQALVAHSKLHNHVVSKTLLSPGRAAAPVKRPPGQCRFCGEMFTPIELRNHLKTHPEFRPHQCDHCGRCFANLSNLLAHISNHTGEKPHICQNCGKKFFSKALLKSHMKCHSKERLYCCSYCGKCFLNAGNLNIHVRIHTGEKPYTCLECGKAFSSAGRLQVHRRCHTGEKPYECNVCGRGFVVSSHRTIHMRSHTGVKPFTCEFCGKTFARRNCWNEHMYSHTDAKPFPCSFCSKSFIRRSHLKRHMQSHIGDQSNVL